MGPKGAGKTTTMRIITRFMAPTHGQVIIGVYDVFETPLEVKKQIGSLPETPPVYGERAVKLAFKHLAQFALLLRPHEAGTHSFGEAQLA